IVVGPPVLGARLKSSPDLQAQVVSASGKTPEILAVSPVAIGAKSPLVLDIALPAGTAGLPSEYETLTAALSRVYAGRLKDLEGNDGAQDVTYLGAKTGWDARAVAMASLADRFSTLSIRPAGAIAATTEGRAAAALSPEFYYALFRAGVPA